MRPKVLRSSMILLILGVSPSASADTSAAGQPQVAAPIRETAPTMEVAPNAGAEDPLRFGPVKLGLDVMARGEAASNFNLSEFAFTPGNDEARILFRVRPSVAYRPADWFRAR